MASRTNESLSTAATAAAAVRPLALYRWRRSRRTQPQRFQPAMTWRENSSKACCKVACPGPVSYWRCAARAAGAINKPHRLDHAIRNLQRQLSLPSGLSAAVVVPVVPHRDRHALAANRAAFGRASDDRSGRLANGLRFRRAPPTFCVAAADNHAPSRPKSDSRRRFRAEGVQATIIKNRHIRPAQSSSFRPCGQSGGNQLNEFRGQNAGNSNRRSPAPASSSPILQGASAGRLEGG